MAAVWLQFAGIGKIDGNGKRAQSLTAQGKAEHGGA